jgi:hypothetical protein
MPLSVAQRHRLEAATKALKPGTAGDEHEAVVRNALREEYKMTELITTCSGFGELEEVLEDIFTTAPWHGYGQIDSKAASNAGRQLVNIMAAGGGRAYLRQLLNGAGEAAVVAGLFITVIVPAFFAPPDFAKDADTAVARGFFGCLSLSLMCFLYPIFASLLGNYGMAVCARDADVIAIVLKRDIVNSMFGATVMWAVTLGIFFMMGAMTCMIHDEIGDKHAYAFLAVLLGACLYMIVWHINPSMNGLMAQCTMVWGLTGTPFTQFGGPISIGPGLWYFKSKTDPKTAPIIGPSWGFAVEHYRRRIAIGKIIDLKAKQRLSELTGASIYTPPETESDASPGITVNAAADPAALDRAGLDGFGGSGEAVAEAQLKLLVGSSHVDEHLVDKYTATLHAAGITVDMLVRIAECSDRPSEIAGVLEEAGIATLADRVNITLRLKAIESGK